MSKVSIVVPIYNVEKYIDRTIKSVINQTEKDIEIILVNDGSTDNCGDICDKFAIEDYRIKVLHKPNGGLSSARNAGTLVATSDYIMYLDGDDYLREDAVDKVLQTMDKYPSDFIQFMYKEVQDNGGVYTPKNSTDDLYQAKTPEDLFENLYRLGGVAASCATKLFKRELMLKVPFENITHEDEMWCTRAFQLPLTATYISDELYLYVMRNNSIIHSVFNCKKFDIFKVCKERIKVLRSINLSNLVGKEYEKIFYSILRLYNDAKYVGDKGAILKLKEYFMENKEDIKEYSRLPIKFYIIFCLMCLNFNFINIYNFYWKVKEYKK